MKKVILLSIVFLLLVAATFAQSSQAIPYQAIARDTTGTPIPNQHMNAQMSIFDSVATGTAIYVETDTFTTSNLGMFTINIGQGMVVSGTFSAINWSKNPKFLQVGLDPSGGTRFLNMGTAQLLNVPFALYALQSGTSSPPTGTGQQIPYFSHTGVFTGDPYFTRNDTNYTTNLMRVKNGVQEGVFLGQQPGLGNKDGAYFMRYDTAANHVDVVGEFYGTPWGGGADTTHQIGLLCYNGNTGSYATVLLEDSNPVNTTIQIGASNNGNWAGVSSYSFDTAFIGLLNSSSNLPSNGILADTLDLHLISNNTTWNWPTTDGLPGQSLTTDGSGNLSWGLPGGVPIGPAWQAAYYNRSGALQSDSLFTRDSTYATQILRTTSGGVYEGFNLGPGLSGYGADGVFLTRIDTPEGHYDYIGEGNLLGSNAIGILCTHGLTSNGASATIAIVDSNPVNSLIHIETSNDALISYHGKEDMAPTEVSFGVNGAGGYQSFIDIDTVTVHIIAGTTTWNWPTVDGANGQTLTTDGSGNLSWSNNNFANKSVFTPTTGNTITAVWGNNIVNPASGLSALTITLPSSPVDNETVFFTFTNTITSLSFTGGTISGAGGLGSVSSVANGNVKYSLTYDSGSGTWY